MTVLINETVLTPAEQSAPQPMQATAPGSSARQITELAQRALARRVERIERLEAY